MSFSAILAGLLPASAIYAAVVLEPAVAAEMMEARDEDIATDAIAARQSCTPGRYRCSGRRTVQVCNPFRR